MIRMSIFIILFLCRCSSDTGVALAKCGRDQDLVLRGGKPFVDARVLF